MPVNNIVLFDGYERPHLLPLTATKAIADLRIGILTIREKWEKHLNKEVDILTVDYLNPKYNYQKKDNSVYINSTVLPSKELVEEILNLKMDTILKSGNELVAARILHDSGIDLKHLLGNIEIIKNHQQAVSNISKISFPWNIFTLNGAEIRNDIQLLKLKSNPDTLSKTNTLIGNDIYVEDGVKCECSILNSNDGPIYLGKDSEIMEGCTIRAPFALGEHATLKMQTKVYGDTTIGPYCKVGGEISNSILMAYSNKGHDGFLGNSVIGEWCNLGADTNNSNLKNNYGKVKAYSYVAKDYINTNLQFCGVIMGDHSKAAINTQFNTGTVVGVCANVFNAGFPPKFIPDFSWGNEKFELEKAYEVAQRMMERRKILFTEIDKNILKYIFEH